MHPLKHFITITHHRHLVCRYCFRLGLYWQGLTHDLSKYTPTEFIPGAKFYQGTRSPNDAERRTNGVSLAWLHHKGRNRHHFEYWIDYVVEQGKSPSFSPLPMPKRYIAEMFCDRIAASRTYQGKSYTDRSAYEYYIKNADHIPMHEGTKKELEKMLRILADEGENAAFSYVRAWLREKNS